MLVQLLKIPKNCDVLLYWWLFNVCVCVCVCLPYLSVVKLLWPRVALWSLILGFAWWKIWWAYAVLFLMQNEATDTLFGEHELPGVFLIIMMDFSWFSCHCCHLSFLNISSWTGQTPPNSSPSFQHYPTQIFKCISHGVKWRIKERY